MEIHTGIVLILEDEDNIYHNWFNSTNGFEDFLTTIDLKNYERTNILFYYDGEMNDCVSKLYHDRYIKKYFVKN